MTALTLLHGDRAELAEASRPSKPGVRKRTVSESYERKAACARATAEVLTAELGIKCYADSRLD